MAEPKPKLPPTDFNEGDDVAYYKQNTSPKRESSTALSGTPASSVELVELSGSLERDRWQL